MEYVNSEFDKAGSHDIENNYWSEKIKAIDSLPTFYGQRAIDKSTASTRVTIRLGSERTQKLKTLAEHPELRSFSLQLTLFNIFSTVPNGLPA